MNPAIDGHAAYALAMKLIQDLGFNVHDVRNVLIDPVGITVTTYSKWQGKIQSSTSGTGVKLETHFFKRDMDY